MADTVKRFHADQKAQKELEDLREKMAEMEKVMKVMLKMPGFDRLIEEVAEQSS
jgi:Tfp pilus assembly protein PilO